MQTLINPYIAGNPVGNTSTFVGRDDVLREVVRVLRSPRQNAITLYGQRRIGKTSMLQHMIARLPQEGAYQTVYFDLQDKVTLSLDGILFDLAVRIADKLGLPSPKSDTLTSDTFKKEFIPSVLNDLPKGSSLVLLLDEFDVLADPKSVKTGAVFFPYLRELLSLDPTRLQFVFVLGRNITDLSAIALSLFKGVPSQRVSLLSKDEAERLIRVTETEPTSMTWSDQAIKRVWDLTHGHPFLTQQLCSVIWENAHEDESDDVPQITPNEVDAAIPVALEASRNTLEWLWGGLGPAQRMVTAALAAAGDRPVTEDDLEKLMHESGVRILVRDLHDAPQLLQSWDILEPVEGGYTFRVELLRRWLTVHKPLSRVQQDLDRIQPAAENLFQAALGLYEGGNIQGAEPPLQQALNLNPSHVRANELLSEIFIARGEYTRARELLEKLQEFAPLAARGRLAKVKQLEKDEGDLSQHFLTGQKAARDSNWSVAHEELQWVVEHHPEYVYEGQSAKQLLEEVYKHIDQPLAGRMVQRFQKRKRGFLFSGGIILILVIALYGLTRPNNNPFAPATSTLTSTLTLTPSPSATFTKTPTPSNTPTMTLTSTTTPTVTLTPTLFAGYEKIREADGMTMIYIPAGSFIMGSVNDTSGLAQPEREVTLRNAYWMDKTEVTNAMFATFLISQGNEGAEEAQYYDPDKDYSQIHPSDDSWFVDTEKDNYPVNYVSWFGAKDYCTWVGGRLPTEAEWEYAARGSDMRKYPWGDDAPNHDLANFGGRAGSSSTDEVGSYPHGASPFGILDMAGNVSEWVFDGAYYYKYLSTIDPKPEPLDNPIVRGGSYISGTNTLSTWFRFWGRGWGVGNRTMVFTIGFRCVVDQ